MTLRSAALPIYHISISKWIHDMKSTVPPDPGKIGQVEALVIPLARTEPYPSVRRRLAVTSVNPKKN